MAAGVSVRLVVCVSNSGSNRAAVLLLSSYNHEETTNAVSLGFDMINELIAQIMAVDSVVTNVCWITRGSYETITWFGMLTLRKRQSRYSTAFRTLPQR